MPKEKYLSQPALWQKLPLFYQPWWLDITSAHWDMVLAEEEGVVTGVFPCCSDRRMGLTIVRNPLLTPYLGPFFLYPSNMEEAQKAAFEERTMAQLWQQMPRWDSFDMETTTSFLREDLLQQASFTTSHKITYEINLEQPEEKLWSAMHQNHRHLAKQAMQQHQVATGLAYLPDMLQLHRATFTRKDKSYPFPPAMIEDLIKESTARNAGALWALTDPQDRVTAGIFTVWDHKTMYLLLSATDVAHAHAGAVRLLIWRAMQDAQQKGLRIFDFEGSMDPGIAAFFRRFGGERMTYLCAGRNKSFLWKIKKSLRG